MTEDEAGPSPTSASPLRVAILAGIASIVGLGAFLAIRSPRGAAPVASPRHRDGGAAIHAPIGPTIAPPDTSGVRLTGLVVDGAGIAVAGAEVTAELERGPVERALITTAPTDAGVADATSSGSATGSTGSAGSAGSAGAGSAATAAIAVAPPTAIDGRFVIGGLAAGRYRVRVTGPGLLAAEVRYVPVPSDEARIVVARQVAIDGVVSDGGKPVAAAHVGIRGDAIGGTLELKTDGQGAFHVPNLPEGRYQVFAWQGALAARTVRVGRLGAGPFGSVALALEAGTIVVGRVVGRDEGTGLAAAIELRPSGDDQAPRYARSGDDGVFRIEGVPTGRWIADAFAPGFLSPGGIELDAGRGTPELVLARGGAIEGRVLDVDGHPVVGAAVRALTAGGSPVETSAQVDQDRLRRFSGRTSAPTPTTGTPVGDPQLIPRGELGVMVGPIPPLPPPGTEVARPAAITDPTIASAQLAGEPAPLEGDPSRRSVWITDSDGHFRIRGFAKSTVTVIASAAGLADARSRAVAVAPGEVIRGVEIVMTAGTFVVGKVTDQHGVPVVGAELAARPEVGAPIEGFSDGDGLYRIGPLTGSVVLHASAYGHVEVEHTIALAPSRGAATNHEEDLVLDIADAILAGTLDDSTGTPIPGAHLEVTGGAGEGRRVVVAADGTFLIELLPRGRLRVHVEHPDFPSEDLEAVASATGERAHLVLPIGGGIEGVLLDGWRAEPLASVTLVAAGPGGRNAEASTDSAGRWKLGPLRPGRWTIEAKLPGYLPQHRAVEVTAARTPGATSVRDIRIELARGALVGGTVRDTRGTRLAASHVVARALDGSGLSVEADTDSAGEFRLRDCPTGELAITASRGDNSGTIKVTVRGGDEVLGLAIDVK